MKKNANQQDLGEYSRKFRAAAKKSLYTRRNNWGEFLPVGVVKPSPVQKEQPF